MDQQSRPAFGTSSGLALLVIAYLGFISLGLPDAVGGVAWPSVREAFTLRQGAFGLVALALGCGYCASGFFGGQLTHWLGLGNLLVLSSGLVAVAMFGSGLAPVWPVFVACAVIWGLGSGGIDAGLNAYVSKHFSARHVNWLHACYSLGATAGPLLMTLMLVQLGSWRLGYGVVGGVLLAMTALFLATRHGWADPIPPADQPTGEKIQPVAIGDVLGNRLAQFQVVTFFLYVGLESTVGQWCFTLLTESRSIPAERAGVLTGVYYGAIGVGRILAGAITARIELDPLVRGSLAIVLLGTLLFAFGRPLHLDLIGLGLIGLGLAPVFPCLMAQTPVRLGAHYASHAIGFQVSAGMLGAALLPGLAGLVAESQGLEAIAQLSVLLAALLLGMHELILASARRRLGRNRQPSQRRITRSGRRRRTPSG